MILVDPLFDVSPAMVTGRWPYKQACHMMSDLVGPAGLEELLAMADKLGLRRVWLQTPATGPHFDLAASKRAQAIRAGAVGVAYGEFALRCVRPWLAYAREHRAQEAAR